MYIHDTALKIILGKVFLKTINFKITSLTTLKESGPQKNYQIEVLLEEVDAYKTEPSQKYNSHITGFSNITRTQFISHTNLKYFF